MTIQQILYSRLSEMNTTLANKCKARDILDVEITLLILEKSYFESMKDKIEKELSNKEDEIPNQCLGQ